MHRGKYEDFGALISVVIVFIGIYLMQERWEHKWEEANYSDIFGLFKGLAKSHPQNIRPCTMYVA